MPRDLASAHDSGLSLWLTDWKVAATGLPWPGRRFVVLVGDSVGGHLDYALHPDGQALTVAWVNVYPDFQGNGLAGVLMDALYAAHPTAWINHGWRTADGAKWWNSYQDPAPERNIHNRPPAEWAAYFNAVDVAADKAQNAHLDSTLGLHGHRDAVYRYGERTEDEAMRHASAYRKVRAARVDPSAHPLHGAVRLSLDPRLHAYVHAPAEDPERRAQALLEQLGHGNLPREWNTSRHAAFEDAYHNQLFQDEEDAQDENVLHDEGGYPPAATHVVFTVRPLPAGRLPLYNGQTSWLDFADRADIPLEVTAVSWRSADVPATTHTAQLTSPVPAAIAPLARQHATAAYQARYDETGFLRETAAPQSPAAHPYAHRATAIRAVTDRLMREVADRTPPSPPPASQAPLRNGQQPSPPPHSPGVGPVSRTMQDGFQHPRRTTPGLS